MQEIFGKVLQPAALLSGVFLAVSPEGIPENELVAGGALLAALYLIGFVLAQPTQKPESALVPGHA